ncbi:MAG TPA: FtsX-like permease family protein [candidate division Zixibacteria bacterium]|nr:FtsX-like permease family protein [candidate division Zixibacteria bacterium]
MLNVDEKSPKNSFSTLLKIFLRVNRKRFLINILLVIITFTIFTTFFITWFNYRYNLFYDYLEDKGDWYNNFEVSVHFYDVDISKEQDYEDNFNLAVEEINDCVNLCLPDFITNFTVGIKTELYKFRLPMEEIPEGYMIYQDYLFSLYDDNTYFSCEKNLIAGRMPQNNSELIYFTGDNSYDPHKLNDFVSFIPNYGNHSLFQNFTIVGILAEDFLLNFYNEGYSSDLFISSFVVNFASWETVLSGEIFIMPMDFFSTSINKFIALDCSFSLLIDYKYQITTSQIRNLDETFELLYSLPNDDSYQFSFSYDEYYLCEDLKTVFVVFHYRWLYETIQLLAWSIPLIFLFGILSLETFHLGEYEKTIKYQTIHVHGIQFKTLHRLIISEKLLLASIGLIMGFLLGVIIGYFIYLDMNISVAFLDILKESTIYISLAILFVTFFIGSYVIERILLNRLTLTIPGLYKKKRLLNIDKFISVPEIIFIILGLGVGCIAFLVMEILVSLNYFNNPLFEYHAFYNFSFALLISSFFLLAALFSLFSRLICRLLDKLGKKAWQKEISLLTLPLKHLSAYKNSYRRTILAMLMTCLGITPGFIMNQSVNRHLSLESSLATGCSDILVGGWDLKDRDIITNLTEIDGIEKVTSISYIRLWNSLHPHQKKDGYELQIINIHNITEFVDIIDFSLLQDPRFTIDDIQNLDINMSCLMSSKYAKENNYHSNEIFSSARFTNIGQSPFEMSLINCFDYFPLIPSYSNRRLYPMYDYFSLVTNNQTSYNLINHASDTSPFYEHYFLVKVTNSANLTDIQNVIKKQFYLDSISKVQIEGDIELKINDYKLTLLTILTIIVIFSTLLFGLIAAKNIFSERIRVIEAAYQVGARKSQIVQMFSMEFFLVLLLPAIISISIIVTILYTITGFLFNIQSIYTRFLPWLPWWLILLILLFSFALIFCSWLILVLYQIQHYKPIKHV